MQARLGEAEGLKQEGNDLFRRGKWNEALQIYRNGLAQLPKRRNPPSPPSPPATATDSSEDKPPLEEGEATGASSEAEPTVDANVDPLLERECVKARSVLHANIAACHVKLVSAHAPAVGQPNRRSWIAG